MAPRADLALALDLPLEEAKRAWAEVSQYFGVAKVGLSLFVEHGPAVVKHFVDRGASVFLDLKLHDIPNTVELAATQAGALGVSYLTVHASGGAAMVQAAVRGATEGAARVGKTAPVVLAVTVLTSLDTAALAQTGVTRSPEDHAAHLAKLAAQAGATGLVCSASEVASVRAAVGPSVVLCTPGIRPAGAEAGDQARVETPAAALRAGSNLLVIGRPVTQATDRPAAAASIVASLQTDSR